jgi:hypothetical protein
VKKAQKEAARKLKKLVKKDPRAAALKGTSPRPTLVLATSTVSAVARHHDDQMRTYLCTFSL